jgi:hypothetical protein
MRYFLTIDQNGRPLNGTTLSEGMLLPEEYTHEVTEEIWNNQGNYQFVDGQWEEVLNETTSGE